MIEHLDHVNMNQGEVRNMLLDKAVPGTPVEAQVWYDTVTKRIYFRDDAGNVVVARTAADLPIADAAAQFTTDNVEAALAQAASQIDTLEGLSHTQGTDTGTTASTFQIDSDASGPKLKNVAGELQARNAGDTDYADLRVKNLVVEGTTTSINSNTVAIGDSEIELNSDVATAAANSDGGIAVKRLQADDTTRADAKMTFDNSTGRWKQTFGPTASTQVAETPVKREFTFGDGVARVFALAHNLGTRAVVVSVYRNSGDYDDVTPTIERTDLNTITVRFNTGPVPAVNSFKATVIG
jgi:hypothetical protein